MQSGWMSQLDYSHNSYTDPFIVPRVSAQQNDYLIIRKF